MKNEFIIGFSVLPKIEPIEISYEECRDRYENKRLENKDFLIYAERIPAEGFEPGISTPVLYHLFDFTATKGLRGIHLVIETNPGTKKQTAKAISIEMSGHYGLSSVRHFSQHTPKLIAGAIRSIERKIVKINQFESPLFSGRADHRFYYYGLMFELDKLL